MAGSPELSRVAAANRLTKRGRHTPQVWGSRDMSTARSRELGARMREARQMFGWTGRRLAEAIGWSQAKASRLETGNRPAELADVAYVLGFCQMPQRQRDAVLELLIDEPEGYWVRPHRGALPEAVPSVVFQQDAAKTITCFDPCGIPPMLQTAEYAEAELLPRFDSSAEAMAAVRDRLGRHSLLHWANGPVGTFYLHESALRAMPVEPEVRAGQLLVLLMLIGRDVSIRVVPADREHGRWAVGAFQVLGFGEFPAVVCVPTQTATLLLEQPDDVAEYRRVLAELDAVALSQADSTVLIQVLADEAQEAAPVVGATEDEDELEALIEAHEARKHMRDAG